RRRSLRFPGRASPNSAAKKTPTHPDFATGRCPRHSRPGHPDRIRPSSAASTQVRDFARRAYLLLQQIQSPRCSRKKRLRTADRRGKEYGLALAAPDTKFCGNLPPTWAKARLRCVSFSTRLIKFVALRSDSAPIQKRCFVGQDGQIGRYRRSTLSALRP